VELTNALNKVRYENDTENGYHSPHQQHLFEVDDFWTAFENFEGYVWLSSQSPPSCW
jgi:hypothetical protein